MKKQFSFLLDNYDTFLLKDLDNNSSLDTQMKSLITDTIPKNITSLLNLNTQDYAVEGSYGIGGYTYTPWIAIFDKDITESAQRGFYIVILVKADFSGFYLSLNQGTKYITDKFKGNKPINIMNEIASLLRLDIDPPFGNDSLKNIDLISKTDNAKKYAAANIWAKYYSKGNLPSDIDFKDDLIKLERSMKRIKRLMGVRTLDTFLDDLLFKEEIDEIKFLEDVHLATSTKTERKPQPPAKKRNSSNGSVWVRNPKKAKEALENANFKCEIDENHITFTSAATKKNFVEAHHLIPITQQDHFGNGIDEPGNIVSLCPNCHRQIHLATKKEKEKLLNKLYKKKENDLKDFDIHIPFAKPLKMYEI